MMKFMINSVPRTSARIGTLTDIPSLPGVTLRTPLLMLYTKGGSIPHITHEVLQMITHESQAVQVPLPSTINIHHPVSQFGKGIGTFIGLKDHLIYCTVQDPAVTSPQGFNQKDSVSIASRGGLRHLDAKEYMQVMESFQPDMYQCLCDGDTNINSAKKRVQKAADRTESLLEKCISIHEKSEHLKNSALLGIVEGGYSINARKKAASAVGKSAVAGFVIDGLHTNGPDTLHIPFQDVKPILEETISHLPPEKFRIVHGCWDPSTVLNMVELGVDVFDASYPFIATEEGYALTFQYNFSQRNCQSGVKPAETGVEFECDKNKDRNEVVVNGTCEGESVHSINSCSSKSLDEEKSSSAEQGGDDKSSKPLIAPAYGISLRDARYVEDFSPLCDSCSCLACRKHTRAYLHHLLNARELLASVLLMIHNLHHYLEFFKKIQEALKQDSLDDLKVAVSGQQFHGKCSEELTKEVQRSSSS